MKVLSVQQPWASLIAAGIKDVENRTWKPKVNPGRILIHASKKCSERTVYNEPIEWVQEILLEKFLGNIPDFPDMPSNAIIGYVTVEKVDKDNAYSAWASGESNDENLFYWHLKDAYLFDEPITAVKGKLWLWDYELDENNLPPAHQVPLKGFELKDDVFEIDVTDDYWNNLAQNQSLDLEFSISLTAAICDSETLNRNPCNAITFYNKGNKRTFKLTDKTQELCHADENGKVIFKYLSVFNPEGAERWIMHFEWSEEIK